MADPRPDNINLSFHSSGERPAARYVSDTAVHEEALHHTRLIGLYWAADGQVQRENVAARLPGVDPLAKPLHAFELEIDGQSLHNRWEWAGASERDGERPGTIEAVVELTHQVRPVTVKVITRMDGSPVLARWLEITNTGSEPAALSHVAPWSGMLWNTDPAWNPSVASNELESMYTLGHMPSEVWGEEGDFVWTPLPTERYRIERAQGRSHGSPYLIIRNEITGEMCFVALAWSGNWYAELIHRVPGFLGFRIGPLGTAPLRVIDPGETVISPEVHLGMFHCDMDTAVSAWHKHVRASVLPPRPKGKEMYTIAGRVVEAPDEWILREVDIAAEMGCEAFMVDAGWYGDEFGGWTNRRGDWHEGDWLPGGMAGIRQHTHDKGLLFGLWMEPETLGAGSITLKEHPEWIQTTDDGIKPAVAALNFGLPEVRDFYEEAVTRVIRDFKLDFFKQDYNITTLEGGQNLTGDYAEHESWRHYETVYGMFDRIRKEFPNVALENCAGGGGRNDLGMMSRFHYCCESDMSSFPLSIRTINAMTLFLPPEAICYYHNHVKFAHMTADLDTHLRVTLFALPIFVGFGGQDADRTSAYFAKTRRYIELAKTFCRPIMADRPVVYHHTPDIGVFRPADWCVLEYASQDRLRGYAGLFKLAGSQPGEYLFRPRGLDLSKDYDVTLDNGGQSFRISGRDLALTGLPVTLGPALTSELLMFKAAGS